MNDIRLLLSPVLGCYSFTPATLGVKAESITGPNTIHT